MAKKKVAPDTTWPPTGVRDLKPDVPVRDRPDHVRFPTLRAALERAVPQTTDPVTDHPDMLTEQRVLELRNRTRSRAVEYLCRAYLQFGSNAMSTKDLERLCTAIKAQATQSPSCPK